VEDKIKILLLMLSKPLLFARKVTSSFKRFYSLYLLKDEFTVEVARLKNAN